MKKWLTFIFFTFIACRLMASAVSFKADLSSERVEVGQRFRITFTVNSGGGNFTPPSFAGFRLLSGPNQSSSMQYVNGKTTRTFSISYILEALKAGEYKFDPATIDVDGERLESNAVKLVVVDANSSSANAQNTRQNERKNSGNELSDYVYIKAFVDKKSAYVGEKVTATYKLYSRLGISSINLESLPALNGFWSHDLHSVYDQIQLGREYIDGEVYQVATLKQSLLYPQRSGELVIDPLSMKAMVQVRSQRSRSLFESMFGSYENKELIIGSRPLKVDIKPLPPYRGKGEFSGAVGQFKVSINSNKKAAKANEAIDLKVEISGEGNLPLIGAPQLNFPPDLEVYDPETENGFKNSAAGSSGQKVFKYLIIPRHAGNYLIEPYQLNYFDLKTKTYKSIQTDSIYMQIAKGVDDGTVVYSSSNRKEDVEMLEQDIRFIHLTNLMLLNPEEQLYGSSTFYLLLLLFVLMGIGAYFYSKRFKAKNLDTIGLRKNKAKKLANKRLAKAKSYMDKMEKSQFYEEISLALYGYFADRYNMGNADFSKELLIDKLKSESASEELIGKLSNTIDSAEMAKYAPSAAVEETALYSNAKQIIEETEALAG